MSESKDFVLERSYSNENVRGNGAALSEKFDLNPKEYENGNDDDENVEVKNKKFIQIFAAISGSLTKFSTGMMTAWTSPSLPKLQAEDSPIPLTHGQSSWVTGCYQIGGFLTVFLMAATVDIFGRKRGILFSAFPVLISWLLIIYANSPGMLYTARIVGGIGGGYGKIVTGTYIGEIAEPEIRGALGTFMAITYNLGLLFVYCIGPYVSIQTFGWMSTVIPITLFLTFMWMPETPYFYLMNGQVTKARRTLEKLRGHKHIEKEFDRISQGIEKKQNIFIGAKDLFCVKSNRKGLIIITFLFLSIQFCGKIPIIAYSQSIFDQAGGAIPPDLSSIITCLVQLVAFIVSTFTVDRCGRRPLLISSCFGSGISLGVLSIYFYLKEMTAYDTTPINWIPLVSLMVYNFVFNIGIGNIPFIMVGEMFPAEVKALAVCLTSLCLPLASLSAVKLYQEVIDDFGICTPFGLFSAWSFIAAVFIVFQVPETKGKSLEEIQEYLTDKKLYLSKHSSS